MLANNSLAVTDITEHSSCNWSLETTFTALELTTSVVILFGNFLVFVAIVTSRTLRQQPMNQFLASLAVTDMIMGAFVSPGYSSFCLHCREYSISKYCWLLESAKDLAFGSSLLNVLAISYDRYVSVYWPLRYSALMTQQRVDYILYCIWGVGFVIAGIRHMWIHTKTGSELHAINSRYNTFLTVVIFLIPCVIITVINVKIILAIRKQTRRVSSTGNTHAQNAEGDNSDELQAETTRRRKGTFACIAVVILFVVSWLPRVGFNILYKLKGDLGKVNTLLLKLSMFFLTVQSSINPLIYSVYRADFRKAAVRLLRCNNN